MSISGQFLSRDGAKQGAFGEIERRYGRALYDAASQVGKLEDVTKEVETFGKIIDVAPDLQRFLVDKRIDVKTALSVLRSLGEHFNFGTLFKNFMILIAKNRRLPYFKKIVMAYAARDAEKKGLVFAEIRSVASLTDEQLARIRQCLSDGKKRIVIHTHIDPSLFGGFVVRVGDKLYDASLRSRLLRLYYAMKGAA